MEPEEDREPLVFTPNAQPQYGPARWPEGPAEYRPGTRPPVNIEDLPPPEGAIFTPAVQPGGTDREQRNAFSRLAEFLGLRRNPEEENTIEMQGPGIGTAVEALFTAGEDLFMQVANAGPARIGEDYSLGDKLRDTGSIARELFNVTRFGDETPYETPYPEATPGERLFSGAIDPTDVARFAALIPSGIRAVTRENPLRITYRPSDIINPDSQRPKVAHPDYMYGINIPGQRMMPYEEVPNEIYHVTTNAPAVNQSGVLRVSGGQNQGVGGISGRGAVSFTVSPQVAESLAQDLKVFAELKNLETPEQTLDYFRNLLRSEGLDDNAINSWFDTWGVTRPDVLELYSKPGKGPAFAKHIFTNYDHSRRYWSDRPPSIIIGDPDSPYWRTVSPEDIGIVRVPKNNLPQEALIMDYDLGQGSLEEIQVYGDVPLMRTPD